MDSGQATNPAPIVFIIQSQKGNFHSKLAEASRESILNQWRKFVPSHVMTLPKVILTSEVEVSTFPYTQ